MMKAVANAASAVKAFVNEVPADPETHDGWCGPKLGDSVVTTRTKGRRTVYLFKAADVTLFDKIAKWKNSKCTLQDAWDIFGSGPLIYGHNTSSPDAIIKLHFGVDRYDYILKCVVNLLDTKGEALRKKFETRMLQNGLIVERERSIENPEEVFIKIITPFSVLCAEAQLMKLRLPLKVDNRFERRLSMASNGSIIVPTLFTKSIAFIKRLFMVNGNDTRCQSATFKRKDLPIFKGGDPRDTCFEEIQTKFFRDSHRSLLTLNLISKVEISVLISGQTQKQKKGIDYLLGENIYTAMFHLHEDENDQTTLRARLKRDWVHKYFAIQPIDDVAAYFGETVGLYFAFAGFYNLWLLISTGLGIIVVLYGLTQAYTVKNGFDWFVLFDNDLTPFFGLFMSLWALLMPVAWDRQTNFFAWRWSTSDYQKEEIKRPQYKGEVQRRSPITGKMELIFPPKKRLHRQLTSSFIILLWILLVSTSIALQVSFGAYLSPAVNNDIAINLFTSLLGLTSIIIMKIPFEGIVERLNEWENYRTKSQFDDALIFKTYIFDFANSYSQLIYYAFVKPNLTYHYLFGMPQLNEYCTKSQCATSVTINLFIIFVGGQIIERFQELAIPWIVARVKQMVSIVRLKSRRSKMIREKKVAPTPPAKTSQDTVIISAEDLARSPSVCSTASASTAEAEEPKSRILSALPKIRTLPTSSAANMPEIFIQGFDEPIKNDVTDSLPEFKKSKTSVMVPASEEMARSQNQLQVIPTKSRASSVMSDTSAKDISRNSVPRPSVSFSRIVSDKSLNQNSTKGSVQTLDFDDDFLIDISEANMLPQYYRDDKLNAFEGIRNEYAQKIIQFGYIALFATSFPLAPLFALLNNIYELRADAFKLLCVYQRPEPFLAQDIGVWGIIIRVIAMLSVATNSFLVSFTSPTFDEFFVRDLSSGEQLAIRLGFIIVFHYCAFALTQAFRVLMPSTPNMVANAMARAQYLDKVRMDQDLEEEDEIFNLESKESLC
ncbi:DUF590-domain-containing protein [Rhizoclosmatium globosum]|uniref:DUF590-domain-containing protein n=1 Tax=Rhizoclosmatium globosum TaxID=329046 RepID=A0A1Y2CUG3_9FUNG|nr:DUF590-domain-containing protein [Rhizoclosmatium globosum]|eukprot:ORY50474.1 DUF590-domain-containing protein [Rhizoclosmatium globosum]